MLGSPQESLHLAFGKRTGNDSKDPRKKSARPISVNFQWAVVPEIRLTAA
jgi:hypothetical protein